MRPKDRPKKLDFSFIKQENSPQNQIEVTLNNIISTTPDPSDTNQILIKKTPKYGTLEHEKSIHEAIQATSDPRNQRIVGLSKKKNQKREDHSLYFPYLSRGNLESHRLTSRLKNDPAGYAWLLNQITCLLETLDYLHTSTFYYHTTYCIGIVHDDIKANNLLLDEKGDVYLADFGSAHPATQKAKNSINTTYSPPEFLADYFSTENSNIDHTKADIWRLGITLYKLIHGYKPEALYFCDDIEQENLDALIETAKNYTHSILAKNAIQALLTLQYAAEKQKVYSPESLLTLLCLAMLTPLEKRPAAKDLLTLINAIPLQTITIPLEIERFIKTLFSEPQKNSTPSIPIEKNKMAFFQPRYPLKTELTPSSQSTTAPASILTGGRTP